MTTTKKANARISLLPACVFTLCLAILFIAAAFGHAGEFRFVLQVLVGSLALWLIWRAVLKASDWTKRWDIFAPGVAFIAAYLVFFSLGSINVFDLPDSFMAGMFSPVPASQWGFYLLGLAGYGLGLWFGKARAHVHPGKLSVRNDWDPGWFWGGVFALSVVMVGSLAVEISRFGVPGISTLAGEERLGIRGVPHFLFMSCAWALFLIVPAYLWSRRTTWRAKAAGYLLLLFIGVALPLLQGGRSDLVVALLPVFFLFHYLKKPWTLLSIASLGLAVVVVLSVLGYLRDYFLDYGQSMGSLDVLGMPTWVVTSFYFLLYVRYNVATFRDVTTVIPSTVPYQHGALTFAPLKTPLPGHHEMSDMFFKNVLGTQFVGAGQPASILGPLYGDFGALGILAGMFLFGLITAKVYSGMVRRQTVLSVILYAWVLQTAFVGLSASVFPYITTLSMPAIWIAFDLLVRKPVTPGEPIAGPQRNWNPHPAG